MLGRAGHYRENVGYVLEPDFESVGRPFESGRAFQLFQGFIGLSGKPFFNFFVRVSAGVSNFRQQKTGPRLPQVRLIVNQFPSNSFVDQNFYFDSHRSRRPDGPPPGLVGGIAVVSARTDRQSRPRFDDLSMVKGRGGWMAYQGDSNAV